MGMVGTRDGDGGARGGGHGVEGAVGTLGTRVIGVEGTQVMGTEGTQVMGMVGTSVVGMVRTQALGVVGTSDGDGGERAVGTLGTRG